MKIFSPTKHICVSMFIPFIFYQFQISLAIFFHPLKYFPCSSLHFKPHLCYLSTNNSNQTLRLPTIHQDSSSQAHPASMKQSYYCFGNLQPEDNPPFYELVISFFYKVSSLQHNHHKDLVSHFEYHTYKIRNFITNNK